jgi:hypothetical protein
MSQTPVPPDPIMRQINDLTDAERDVLGQIAMNCDKGHDLAIIQSLLDKELIGMAQLGVYFTPIYVHIRWCEWCSRYYNEE